LTSALGKAFRVTQQTDEFGLHVYNLDYRYARSHKPILIGRISNNLVQQAGIAMPAERPTARHQSPRWTIVAVLAPLVGLACGFLLALAGDSINAMLSGLRLWFAFGAFGLFAAFKASARNERLWGLTVLAIVLNAIPVLLNLASFFSLF
jgi:hypothetical protein